MKNEKKLIGNRWIYDGVFELDEKSTTKEREYRRNEKLFNPDDLVEFEFTKTGKLIAYLNGAEIYRVPFVFMRGILLVDLPEKHPARVDHPGGMLAVVENEECLWLCEFNECVPVGNMSAMRLIPMTR